MKKFLSVLSLLTLLSVEMMSPLTYVLADSEVDESPESYEDAFWEEDTFDAEEQQESEESEDVIEDVEEQAQSDEQEAWEELSWEQDEETQEWTDDVSDEDLTDFDEEITEGTTDEEWEELINPEGDWEIILEQNNNEENAIEGLIEWWDLPVMLQNISIEESDNTYENLSYVPWEVIVKYIDEIPEENGSELYLRTMSLINDVFPYTDEVSLVANDLEVKEQLDTENTTAIIEIKDDKTVEETIELLEEDPRVEYVEPNYIRQLYSINDPDYLFWKSYWLWAITHISALSFFICA